MSEIGQAQKKHDSLKTKLESVGESVKDTFNEFKEKGLSSLSLVCADCFRAVFSLKTKVR